MEQLVVVRAEPPGRFTAQSLTVPELKAEAATEAAAVEQVRLSLSAWLAKGKLVRVDVSPSGTGNPLLDNFGAFANDPLFDDYLEEVKRAREAADQHP
jgi:hypothetical protein